LTLTRSTTEELRTPTMTDTVPSRNPGLAAVLSVVIPGVGQIYNGDFLRGIFWLIVTPGFWIGTGGMLGWVCHVIASYTAYRRAVRKNLG
jgi:TM2 domain-containing membrane protein YozV